MKFRINHNTNDIRQAVRYSSQMSHLCLHHADDLDVEVLQVLLVLQVELVPAGVQRRTQLLRPVLVTFDPPSFCFLGHHGNDIRFVFPDHLPEGRHCGRQRALAGDVEEFFIANLHADVAGVDVVLVVSNGNTGFVIYGGKRKSEKHPKLCVCVCLNSCEHEFIIEINILHLQQHP